ncbi:unnamed protein product [Fusarium graminearum]|nr:unnamed protein product [Fusarium graminearum]
MSLLQLSLNEDSHGNLAMFTLTAKHFIKTYRVTFNPEERIMRVITGEIIPPIETVM